MSVEFNVKTSSVVQQTDLSNPGIPPTKEKTSPDAVEKASSVFNKSSSSSSFSAAAQAVQTPSSKPRNYPSMGWAEFYRGGVEADYPVMNVRYIEKPR